MTTGRVWQGWAVPLPGGGTYLGPDAAQLVLFLLRYYATAAGARNGLTGVAEGSPMVREVRAACEVAARVSPNGQPLRTPDPDATACEPRPDDLLTTTDVAKELNVTARTARRMAHRGALGPVTHAGRSLLVRRVEVDAHRRPHREANP